MGKEKQLIELFAQVYYVDVSGSRVWVLVVISHMLYFIGTVPDG